MSSRYNFNAIKVGMEFKSFSKLAEVVGGNPKAKGNSRKAMVKEFKRHVDWAPARASGNTIVITEVYERPLPKELRPNNKFDADIFTCLRWGDQRTRAGHGTDAGQILESSYTMRDLMALCGFTSHRWQQTTPTARKELQEAIRNGIAYTTERQAFKFLSDLHYHVNSYCGTVLSRSLKRLVDYGYLESVRTWYSVKSEDGFRDATPREQGELEELKKRVKDELGIKVENLYVSGRLYSRFNGELKKELKLEAAIPTRRIALAIPYERVSLDEYLEARGRINANSLEEFRSCSRRMQEEVISNAQEAFDRVDDPKLLEFIELFDYTPLELAGLRREDIDMQEEMREALLSWFIDIDGADSYIQAHREFQNWTREQVAKTSFGARRESAPVVDSSCSVGNGAESVSFDLDDLDAAFDFIFGETED